MSQSIPKNNNDPYGLEFEIALMKARYVYPAPDNPHAQDIVSHAKQIYESEMLERSLCAFYDSIVPGAEGKNTCVMQAVLLQCLESVAGLGRCGQPGRCE